MDMNICYSIENEPLGTGGGIKYALSKTAEPDITILNGDSFFGIDLDEFKFFHRKSNADVTLALKYLTDSSRYGAVGLSDSDITGFKEKEISGNGHINGGIYQLNVKKFLEVNNQKSFSFEKDFLEKQVGKMQLKGFISDAYFLDIGLPETLEVAQKDFMALF